MSFECNIKISGHTFDIAIKEFSFKTDLCFGYIYPKIREIAKIAANEDIQMSTHYFEIIDSIRKWRVDRLDQFIKHNSTIYIIPKTQTNDVNSKPIGFVSSMALPPTDVDLRTCLPTNHKIQTNSSLIIESLEESNSEPIVSKQLSELVFDNKLKRCENEINVFHAIVLSINIGWNLKGQHLNANWELVFKEVSTNLLVKHKLPNCKEIVHIFYRWAAYYAQVLSNLLDLILNHQILQRYESIDGLLEPFSQKIFDLLKVVHILDLEQLYGKKKNSLTPRKIREISATQRFKDYFQRHLSGIRRKKVETRQTVKQNILNKKQIKERDERINKEINDLLNDTNNNCIPPESNSFKSLQNNTSSIDSLPQKKIVSQNMIINEKPPKSIQRIVKHKNKTTDKQKTESNSGSEERYKKRKILKKRKLFESNPQKKIKKQTIEIETITIE